jgi:hypothetical protein
MRWLAAVSLLMAGAVASADEHCANGDFEALTRDGRAPAQWTYIAADKGDGTLEVAEGVDGGHCAKVTCTRAEGIWGPGLGQTGVVEVKGGQWYDLAFRARQEGITSEVIAALRNTKDWNANHLWQQFHPTSSWREYHAIFKAPYDLAKDVSRLQFSFDSTGTLWLDRVSLTETTAPKSPNVVDVGRAKNRVPNSSFEVGTYGWGSYGHTFLVGEIGSTTAWHGKSSFKLDLSPGKLPVHWNDFTYVQKGKPTHAPVTASLVTAGYLPVTPGKPMALSAYVKADRPGGQVRLGLIEDTGADRSNAVAFGTEWTRVVVPVVPQAETAFVRIGLEPGGPSILWVDAVQLEEGDQPTAYEPALPVEVGFDTERVGNLYHVGETAPLRVSVYNSTATEQTVELKLSLEDFFRQRVAVASIPVTAPPGGVTPTIVALPSVMSGRPLPRVEAPGSYRLRAQWGSPAGPQERRMRFGIVHPLREMYRGKDTFLGQNHSFVSDQLMMLTQDAGTSWVRSWFVRWDDIEPEQGRFDFAEADAQLDRLERLGFNVQFCLGDPTSEWASTAPTGMSESTGAEAESRRVWWLPKDMALYEGYVAALMERYGERVEYWEILNEPVDAKGGEGCNLDMAHNYLRFVQAARDAAERTHAQAEIMGAGLGYLKGMDDVAPVLGAIYILSEHRYPGLQPPEAFQAGLRGAVETMRAKGAVHPIWLTEYGLYADDDPDPTTLTSQFLIHAGEDSEMLAAVATVKHEVVALANGVDKVFFHIGNWPIILNREHGCGFHPFFEWGGIPRKMMITQNALSWALPPGTRFARALSDHPPTMIYGFTTERGSIFIAWSSTPVAVDAQTQAALREAKVYNVIGQPQGKLTEIGEYPAYVVVAQQAADRVGQALGSLAR